MGDKPDKIAPSIVAITSTLGVDPFHQRSAPLRRGLPPSSPPHSQSKGNCFSHLNEPLGGDQSLKMRRVGGYLVEYPDARQHDHEQQASNPRPRGRRYNAGHIHSGYKDAEGIVLTTNQGSWRKKGKQLEVLVDHHNNKNEKGWPAG